ncbi:MAG TPA: KR domain-containing protein [Lachnospiraceae bacterium]|jgi:gluconate 5-dehydrogenase|uniref:Gluconate 5-dehydrogenase n=1 Tax=Anaerosporobacter mobilis DSM 15930 TaxID=1120996 RepID=A0A1M7HUI4_9FIRM|nr:MULTISPECIES: SDR family NAD(P)-dependent oxidoreductase [Anaerosporobacter]MBS5935149.1 SDR family oxidoreductase [Clostridiales bacterium]SHM32120.1 gluconate 5-dehydrogenase [Anaerosporobacter mobilis DSM 15930]HAB60340.1 KR domain-containing protein [Lachnospiraceae bacterium]
MENLFDLTGKVAVVTGASSGLGADAALAYAKAGADVAVLARRVDKLNEVKAEIEKTGRKAIAIGCDVTNEESVKEAMQTVIDTFGHIDILLNNAGIAVRGGVDSMTEEDWDKSFDINVKGIFLASKYVIPQMKERGYGKIVNIASVNAVIADKHDMFIRHSYNASKSAVLGLTKGMACSYARYGITVNAIGPALFESEMTAGTLFKSEQFLNTYNAVNPAGRPGNKGELNGTVLYLSSDASSYVQGQFIIVDGGGALV